MHIASVQNARVKLWSQLLDKKGRDKQGQFLIEGVHLVTEAIHSGAPIDAVVYSEARGIPSEVDQAATEAVEKARAGAAAGAPAFEWISVSEDVLLKCSDTQTPQGIFAVVNKPAWSLEVLWGGGGQDQPGRRGRSGEPLVVVVDGVQDPGNLGTIIRSADAVGATAVVLGRGTVDLYNPKTVRSTMGSLFHLPIVEAELGPLLEEAGERELQLVVASLQASESCYAVDFTRGTWFIVGNEARGVSETASRLANRRVIIPMAGDAESLNVAMAATVLLFEASRQRLT